MGRRDDVAQILAWQEALKGILFSTCFDSFRVLQTPALVVSASFAACYADPRALVSCPLFRGQDTGSPRLLWSTESRRVDRLLDVYFSDEPENFSPYILDMLLSAYCFGGDLSESRSRDFSCERLTILEGMLRIVAIG